MTESKVADHTPKECHQAVSIIIPTYNRPQLVWSLLRYYQKVGCSHTIVLADSSSPPAREMNRKAVASFQGPLRVHYEQYNPAINLILKITQALDVVNSRYAVLCADDDFIVPRAIDQCVQFLEDHPDYSIAHGQGVSIGTQPNAYDNSHHNLRTCTYRQRTIDFDDPQLRLQNHLIDYAPTFYSVHRRLDLLRNLELVCNSVTDYQFGELLASCLSLIQGKAKRLDILYLVRQSFPDTATLKTISWPQLLTSDDFSHRYMQFRNCLAEALVGAIHVPLAEAKDAVNAAFLAYLACVLESKLPRPAAPGLNAFQQIKARSWQVIRVLPAAIHSALFDRQLIAMVRSPRRAFRQLQYGYSKRREERLAKQDPMYIGRLLDDRTPFHADFLPVYEHVIRYSNGVAPALRKEEHIISHAFKE